ncbi:MAG: Thiosulfate sulfurtransferase [Candidatus Angelobacter sp.]|nr:Thiosulfate sulfurtransferase [Candidatus Angelobacter sp.]
MLRKLVLAALALVQAPILTAQSTTVQPKLRQEMLVTTAWLAENLSEPDVVVLCISSTADFYAKGHIPGARQIMLSDIAITRDGVPNELPSVEALQRVFAAAGVSNSSRVVLYGERYNLLATRAYFTLDYLGVAARVALLDGGQDKWTAERRPLSTEIPQVKTATLAVSPRPEILIDTKTMRELSQRKPGSIALVDARPTKEFTGEQRSEDVAKAGHIPGARGLYWMDMLVSRVNPILKPEAELRRMYSELNAKIDQPLVTYCRTGMQSSFDYFVAKYLGYEPSMYDASFFEWSKSDLPAESSFRK